MSRFACFIGAMVLSLVMCYEVILFAIRFIAIDDLDTDNSYRLIRIIVGITALKAYEYHTMRKSKS